jgi:hypothetical chaperone protein
MMSIAFGIDFGTTNSSLAANHNGEVRLIDVEEYLEGEDGINPKLLRSVLYFDDERQVFIGRKAIAQYIGDNTNGRYMQSIKTFLPDLNFYFTSLLSKINFEKN